MQVYSRNLQQLRLRLDQDLKQSKVPSPLSTSHPLSFIADTGSTPADAAGDSDSSKGGRVSRQTTHSAAGSVSIAPRGTACGANELLPSAPAPHVPAITSLTEEAGTLTFRGGCSVVSSASGGAPCGGAVPPGEVVGVRDAESGLLYSSRHIYAPIGEYSEAAQLVDSRMVAAPEAGAAARLAAATAAAAMTAPPLPRPGRFQTAPAASAGLGSRGSSCSVPAPFKIPNTGSMSVQAGGSVKVHVEHASRASTPPVHVRAGAGSVAFPIVAPPHVMLSRSPSPRVTSVTPAAAVSGAATSPVPPPPRSLRMQVGNTSPPMPMPRPLLGRPHSAHRLAAPAPLPLVPPASSMTPPAGGAPPACPVPVWRAPDWPGPAPPHLAAAAARPRAASPRVPQHPRPGYVSPPQSHRSITPPAPAPPPQAPGPVPGTPAADPDFLRRSLRNRSGAGADAGTALPRPPSFSVSMLGNPGGSPPVPPPPPTPPLAAPWEPWAGAQDLALRGPGQPWAPVRGQSSSLAQQPVPNEALQRAAAGPPCAPWGPHPGFASPLAPGSGGTRPAAGFGCCYGAGGSVQPPVPNGGPCGAACGCAGSGGAAGIGGAPYPCSPPVGSRSLSPMPRAGGCPPQRPRPNSVSRLHDNGYAAAACGSGSAMAAAPPVPPYGMPYSAAARARAGAPAIDRQETLPIRGMPYPPAPAGHLPAGFEPGGSLPPTELNVHYQDDGILNSGSGPLVMDVDFTQLCSPARRPQRGTSESHGSHGSLGVPYPESFDYSEPTWLYAPFGAQHQVTN